MPVMSGPQKKLTSAELLLLPDDGKRHELIDGVHYVTPSPRIPHQVLVGRIFVAIANFLAVHQHLGRVRILPLDRVDEMLMLVDHALEAFLAVTVALQQRGQQQPVAVDDRI